MAQLTRRTPSLEDADYLIDYLLNAWTNVAAVPETWSELDAVDKEDFHHEWVGITEARFHELEKLLESAGLSPVQQERYDRLRELVESLKPTIDCMLQT